VRYNATVERVAHTYPEAGGFPRITLHAVEGGGGGEAAGECDGGGEEGWALECDALLVATGREPNTGGLGRGAAEARCERGVHRTCPGHVPVGDLGLDAAGVETGEGGILVDELLATSNPDVYAAGDVVSGTPRLTHVAGEHAKVAVENALFGGAWRHTSLVVPSVIYTEPEAPRVRLRESDRERPRATEGARDQVAMVGMSLAAARAAGVEVEEYSSALAGNDRAILEGEDEEGGFVRPPLPDGDTVGLELRASSRLLLRVHAGEHSLPEGRRRDRRSDCRREPRRRGDQRAHARNPRKGRPRRCGAEHPPVPDDGGGGHAGGAGLRAGALGHDAKRGRAGQLMRSRVTERAVLIF